MPAANPPQEGRFVWYELVTKDKSKAQEFYTALLGWKVQEEDMGEYGKYPMVGVGETWLGGMVSPQDEKIPSHWIAYVTVSDVDAAAEKAQKLGGRVAVPPTDIPNVGRFAAVLDPQGASIFPFKSLHDNEPEMEGPPPAGHFCWNELLTSDPESAGGFYKEVFNWNLESAEMGEMGTYWMYKRGHKEEAGMMKMPPQAEAPPHWLPYIAVDDVDATTKKCGELGGRAYCQPTHIPNIGRFAVLADPEGASFAVFKGEAKS